MTDDLARLTAALADRYAIERELGQGGMATVYLARDLKHDRAVAVKVLRPELAASLGADRFLREIKTTAQLAHPHILPLLDSGGTGAQAHGGTGEFLYYVMPYVEGESLRDRLTREKQLALEDALQLTREVADALSYAHSRGVVHRDVKPENILLQSGHAVVADFGIARAVSAAGSARLTETGLAIGTPAYMSPEQAAGSQDLDGRSDLYSLGCVLYEMLSGDPPFYASTPQAVLAKKLSEPLPRISVVREAVPADIEAALGKALARTPADRFATAAQFAAALGTANAPAQGRTGAPWSPLAWWRRRAVRFAAAAVVLVVIAGAVAVSRWPRPGGHPRTAIAVLPFDNLSAEGPSSYFAGGLHDELLTQLAKAAALSVRARTSVTSYARTTKPLKQVSDELSVGSIVQGSVQVVGNRLRVIVQLIDPVSESHVWAETYDRTLDDAFAVQSEIAQRIVAAVGATLTRAEAVAVATAPTANAEAYRLYLQGEQYFYRPGDERRNYEAAQQLYERALVLDPDFALAHAALSYTHGMMYQYRYDPRPERAARQRSEAETALRLAPALPQAHIAMGVAMYVGATDPSTTTLRRALREFLLAAEGMPGYGEVWFWIGSSYSDLGDLDGFQSAYDRAVALDPRNVPAFSQLGYENWQWHRYAEAVAAFDRALALAPDMALAKYARAMVFVQWRGQLDTLRAVLEHGPEDYGVTSALRARVRLALWERRPDALLAVLPEPQRVIFASQEAYEPGLLWVAWAHQLRGDSAAARRAFGGALGQLDSALRVLPGDGRARVSRGLALAGLGRRAEAQRIAEEMREWSQKVPAGAGISGELRARILAQAGFTDAALLILEQSMAGVKSYLSGPMLRLDPRWDPIRRDPRFQALIRRYGG